MQLKTRVLIIILASLLGLITMGAFGLHAMRQSMYEERRSQISQLLDFSETLLKHYHAQEVSGKLTREEAQARAKEAIGAQRQGNNNYFFIRTLTDDYFVHHPIASRVGKADDGGKVADGRTVVQAYRDELAKSSDNKGFIELKTLKPGAGDNKTYPKLNGALKFEPWGWMPGIGFFIDDIESRFWDQAIYFLAVGVLLLGLVSVLILRMRKDILGQLGGEPHEAVENMRKIASGDLSVNIQLAKGDDSSMMASLKLMQMKLTNITSAIQDNTATLSEQVKHFDEAAKAYADNQSQEQLPVLLKAVAKIGKTADVLNRSIARFKL